MATAPRIFLSVVLAGICTFAHADIISFSGDLDIVGTDSGGAIFSGTPLDAAVTGEISDTSFAGFISAGMTSTDFSCCIAAGGLSISNQTTLDADDADLVNNLSGTSYQAGDQFDTIDIEGDAETPGGGRIEIGISYLLDQAAFSDENLSNYPPDESDVLLRVFFIVEFDAQEEEMYEAIGLIDSITVTPETPEPEPEQKKVPVAITILLDGGEEE